MEFIFKNKYFYIHIEKQKFSIYSSRQKAIFVA